jgi:hypothetical protein
MKNNSLLISLLFFSTTAFSQISTEKNSFSDSVTLDLGTRYWYSSSNVKSEGLNNGGVGYGNPSFVINWSNMTANNLEFFGKILDKQSNFFLKGYIGTSLGDGLSGQMTDVDYAPGQKTTSDTTSNAKQLSATYGVLDIGKDFNLSGTKVSPFVGYLYSKQKLQSYGATINEITSGNYSLYNSLGLKVGQVVSDSINPITYETIIQSPRFGFSLNQPVNEKITFDFELAYMPFANIKLNDTHNAAPNYYVVNGSPNVISSGNGWGWGGDVFMNYQVSNTIKVALGYRYQYFELKDQVLSGNFVNGGWNNNSNLQKLSSQKQGVMFSGEYRF